MNLLIPLPTDADIDTFEREFLQQTYHFTNRDLLRQALQGSGPFNPNGNKVLALAGDAFLRQALVDQGRDRAKCPGKKPTRPFLIFLRLYYRAILTINRRCPEHHHQSGLQ